MEGKAVLLKRFADVDCIDLEVDTRDVEEFVNCVSFLARLSAAALILRHQSTGLFYYRATPREGDGYSGFP